MREKCVQDEHRGSEIDIVVLVVAERFISKPSYESCEICSGRRSRPNIGVLILYPEAVQRIICD